MIERIPRRILKLGKVPEYNTEIKPSVKVKKTRNQIITTRVEVESRIVDYRDILKATRIEEEDEDMGAPWDDHDGWEHEAIRTDEIDWHEDSVGTKVFHCNLADSIWSETRQEQLLITVSRDTVRTKWGNYAPRAGQSKQPAFEHGERTRRRAIEQLKKWYRHGWTWYAVVCEFKDEFESVGGILVDDEDDPYLQEVVEMIADQMAHTLEKEGYRVTHKPRNTYHSKRKKQGWLRLKIAHNLGFESPRAYRQWLKTKVRWDGGPKATRSCKPKVGTDR